MATHRGNGKEAGIRDKISGAAADSQDGPLRVGAVQIGICGGDDPKTPPRLMRVSDCSGCKHGEEFENSDLSHPACGTCVKFSNHTDQP